MNEINWVLVVVPDEAARVFGEIISRISPGPSSASTADLSVSAISTETFQGIFTIPQVSKNACLFINCFERLVSDISSINFNKRTWPDITIGLDICEAPASGTTMKYLFCKSEQSPFLNTLFFEDIGPILGARDWLYDGYGMSLLSRDEVAELLVG